MRYNESKSKKRKFLGSLEVLDDRLLLNAGVPTPPTPAPAPSPVSAALLHRFERGVQRIDRQFLSKSSELNSFVMRRTAQIESMLASSATRAQVKVQQVITASNTFPRISLTTQNQAINTQLGKVVASFNNRVTQLNNSVEQQFGVFSNSLETADARFGIPANAFENNLRNARAALTSNLSTAVHSITAQVQNQTSTMTNAFSNSGTTTSGSSSTGTTSTTGTSTTGTTGTVMTQNFNNAFTQAFSTIDSTINSVDSTLQQNFGTFETQFANNVSGLISTFSTSPFGTFEPTVNFTSGNGVTFTSSTTAANGTTTTTTTTVPVGTIGTVATTTGSGNGTGTTTGTTGTGTTTIAG